VTGAYFKTEKQAPETARKQQAKMPTEYYSLRTLQADQPSNSQLKSMTKLLGEMPNSLDNLHSGSKTTKAPFRRKAAYFKK